MTERARRIVSLLPAATEWVAALGLADAIVGISHELTHSFVPLTRVRSQVLDLVTTVLQTLPDRPYWKMPPLAQIVEWYTTPASPTPTKRTTAPPDSSTPRRRPRHCARH